MRTIILLTAILLAAPATGAEKYSCMEQPEHRQFDFWVGTWQVSDEKGDQLFGENTITIEENGCALRERWKSASGGTGTSINYYNPGDGKWHQLWVDAGSSIIEIAGEIEDGDMVLSGDIYYLAEKRQAGFRGRWIPLPDGTVRQFFEEQDASGEWQTWFDGYYRRVEAND